jgi:hypothetical protein
MSSFYFPDSPKDVALGRINGVSEARPPPDTDPYEWEDETE